MLKSFTSPVNKLVLFLFIFIAQNLSALESDKKADLELNADYSVLLPQAKNGVSSSRLWGNVTIQQGTLKIQAEEAVVYNGADGIDKVILKGTPVKMEQFIDVSYGKINIKAKQIDFMMKDNMLFMTDEVVISSKLQGQMHGDKISMNLKTKEIKGVKTEGSNNRVRLIIPGTK